MKKYFLLLLVTICSCANSGNTKHILQLKNNNIVLTCNVNKIKIRDVKEIERKTLNVKSDKLTFIFASIEISNVSDHNANYNLSEYLLSLYGRSSTKPYIDSPVDFIISEQTLKPKNSIVKSIYWVFDGALTKDDIANIKLVAMP